jgi:hypothetical protein
MSHQEDFKAQIRRCATVHDNTVVLDLRQEKTIYSGNRFMVYALFPQCTVSIHVLWGLKKQNTVLTIGRSIFDRSSRPRPGRSSRSGASLAWDAASPRATDTPDSRTERYRVSAHPAHSAANTTYPQDQYDV